VCAARICPASRGGNRRQLLEFAQRICWVFSRLHLITHAHHSRSSLSLITHAHHSRSSLSLITHAHHSRSSLSLITHADFRKAPARGSWVSTRALGDLAEPLNAMLIVLCLIVWAMACVSLEHVKRLMPAFLLSQEAKDKYSIVRYARL
jgi:hypothetical protein